MAKSRSDFDEAQGSLLGCPPPIRLILLFTHSCQQQAFIEHPLYFTHPLWRRGEHSFPTGSTTLALETSQKPRVSRGHSQPRGPGDITKEISPFYLAASGAEKWQGGSLELQTSALAEPEVVSTPQHFILASLACFHQTHVAKIMCDILKGKEFKPPCLTAPSISFVLLLLMLLSRPHTWCSAEQMLWKGGSARRSRVHLAAWVSSQ